MSRLSEVDKARVIELAKRGVSNPTIASAFGVGRATIWRLTRDTAPVVADPDLVPPAPLPIEKPVVSRPRPGVIPPAPQPFASPYERTRSEIVRLRAKGMTEVQIASLLRIPYREVRACQ